ncbi:aspartate 1-decarboxylase [Brachyspira pilosicoli]|uniref:aspartate 1-decarboxylase n=1 Tax=Brachyspira pilosicoli TaxID=52584 RepID=UPI001C662986|nr:aspartate 1-decarboxylase [Brachyspira pilosicoli]MBW5382602.1 aspartate decarboxylase [Brachyspira pilosicoli]
MMHEVIKSKINRLAVTRTDLNFKDSITIDETLMDKSDILEGDIVSVINLSNNNRFEAEVIKGIANTGIIGINGKYIHLAKKDDVIVVLSYSNIPEEHIKKHITNIIQVNMHNMVID